MTPAEHKKLEQGYGGGSGGSAAAVRKRRRPPPPRREPERTAAPAPARAQEAAKPAAGGGGGKTARIVRTEAGARRYGVQVGQPYTEGKMPGRGDKGPKVTDAKEKLAAIGLFKDLGKEGIQSDVFGPRLEEAVRAFQKEQGLAVTGRLDEVTERRLTRVAPGGDPKDGKLRGGGKDSDESGGSAGSGAGGAGRSSAAGSDDRSGASAGGKGKVTVKKGDTLWAIAERELGDGNRWKEIRDASGLGKDFDPTTLQPGVKLTIPGKAPTEGVGEAPGRGAGSGRGNTGGMSREEIRSALQALPQAVRDDVLRRARQLLAKQLRKG